MNGIFAVALTLVLSVSIVLVMDFSHESSVSAAKFGVLQAGSNDQAELPPMDEQFRQGETTPPDETTQPMNIDKYRLMIRFDQVTVHNDHEGALSGDGEYALNAYVHGAKVDLTKLSQWRDAGLWDVSSGETVNFRPGNNFPVDLDSLTPLSFFTVGWEDDGCKKGALPGSVRGTIDSVVTNETRKNASAAAGAAIGSIYGGPVGGAVGGAIGPQIEEVSRNLQTKLESFVACKVNADDKIGEIIETYEPPRFGTGTHNVKSSSGDFTLTFTIAAQRIQ